MAYNHHVAAVIRVSQLVHAGSLAGYPVDAVLEADCVAGYLRHYAVLYIVEPQVSEEATAEVAKWVKAGGQLFITSAVSLQSLSLQSV